MTNWWLVYDEYTPEKEGVREALCTLGNGYFATRGAGAESVADDIHYPGTYLAGGYNRLKTEIQNHAVENEDLVNLPNWLVLTFRIEEGEWFSLDSDRVDILEYRQTLDIQRGVLSRRIVFTDPAARRTRLEQRRLVHMRKPHLAALETTLVAENWSGRVEVKSALDGRVVNAGVKRYRDLNQRHLEPLESAAVNEQTLYLRVCTVQSRLQIAQAATTYYYQRGKRLILPSRVHREPGYIAQSVELTLAEGEPLIIEKTVALYTGRDQAISESGLAARDAVIPAERFNILLQSHVQEWAHLWGRFDIHLTLNTDNINTANGQTALILRLHMFHLLQTASKNTMDLDVGIPARGWHGEAYRGHIFWDELFIFPLLNLRVPEITRSLLKYRYRRLDEARRAAREAGFEGALYPWQSGSSGREESQKLHLNPKSGRWIPDRTHLQRHVNAAIAYNVWQYYQVTDDLEFLAFYGAKMILEIARCWASLASYNEKLGRYEILAVMGPDEYHDGYPEAEEGGLNNNAYTNLMAVWVLCRALESLTLLPEERRQELEDSLHLTAEELARWEAISRKMRLVFHGDGILSQFEGYEQLKPFDWDAYREKYGDIQRLDRILEAEGDTPNRYQVSKQADVLMLFYLFSAEELQQLFERLGYPFDHDTIPRNINYYMAHTSHGSTLSRVVHSWVLARSDRPESWRLFTEALMSDVADIQGGTTSEGIHLGAMAGTVDLVQRGYTGISIQGDVLWLDPMLPQEVSCLEMSIHYRGHTLDLCIIDNTLRIHVRQCHAKPIKVGVKGACYQLGGGETRHFSL